jgi:hypothetical protein
VTLNGVSLDTSSAGNYDATLVCHDVPYLPAGLLPLSVQFASGPNDINNVFQLWIIPVKSITQVADPVREREILMKALVQIVLTQKGGRRAHLCYSLRAGRSGATLYSQQASSMDLARFPILWVSFSQCKKYAKACMHPRVTCQRCHCNFEIKRQSESVDCHMRDVWVCGR